MASIWHDQIPQGLNYSDFRLANSGARYRSSAPLCRRIYQDMAGTKLGFFS